jgi:hypothetical protein
MPSSYKVARSSGQHRRDHGKRMQKGLRAVLQQIVLDHSQPLPI